MAYAEVINVAEHVNYVLGVTFYAFLLYCLLFRTRSDLGRYRYLQIIMVTVDAAYTTVQMFIRERVVTAAGMFLMIPTSPYSITTGVLCAYLALYNLTFVMIDYSFLYRMWAVKSPSRIRLFSHPVFILILFLIAALETVVWFSSIYFLYVPTEKGRLRVREYARSEFGVDTTSHMMIMGDYFLEDGSLNHEPLSAMIILSAVMAICFGFMVYAFFEIMHHLHETTLISKASVRLQRQLLITLCLQAIIPLVCLYAPCGFTIHLPLLRIDSQLISRATPLLISCFLPLDTLAVLLSMSDYRKEVVKLFRCYRTPKVVSSHTFTTVF